MTPGQYPLPLTAAVSQPEAGQWSTASGDCGTVICHFFSWDA